MKVNNKQETCIETQCRSCNVKLLVPKKDIKKRIAYKKGASLGGYDIEKIKKYPDTKKYNGLSFNIHYKTFNTFTEDIYTKYFKCIICGKKNACHQDKPYTEENFREVNRYSLGAYISNNYNDESNYPPQTTLSKEQVEKMLTWKQKKVFKYLIKNDDENK